MPLRKTVTKDSATPRKRPRAGSRAGASALAVASLLLAVSVRAAMLQGELTLGRGSRRLEVAEAVVWVDRIPSTVEAQLVQGPRLWFWQRWLGVKPPAPPPPPHVIEISRRFLPRVTAAPAHSRVVFQNRDQVWHGVFSVTPGHSFEVGKRAPGQLDTLRVGGAGIVQIRCDIHPDMAGWIVLTPNRAFTRPDALGHWQLPELPPGHYVIRAWHPERGVIKRTVNLTNANTPIRLSW